MIAVGTAVVTVLLLIDGLATNPWVVGAALFVGGGVDAHLHDHERRRADGVAGVGRARGMGLFSLVTVGGLALGSAVWGIVANVSVVGAEVAAAVFLVVERSSRGDGGSALRSTWT